MSDKRRESALLHFHKVLGRPPTQDELSLLDATAAIPPPSGPFHRSEKQPLLELIIEVISAARREGRCGAE
jgi:hypothetical protein